MSNSRRVKQLPETWAEKRLVERLKRAQETGIDPVLRMETGKTCLDCGAIKSADEPMAHDAKCSSALAMDAVVDADREWFRQHKDEESYTRATTEAELAELRFAGQDAQPGFTEVFRTAWGRIREHHPYAGDKAEIRNCLEEHNKKCSGDARESVENVCPCGETVLMHCAQCGEPLFVAFKPGTWCEHAQSLNIIHSDDDVRVPYSLPEDGVLDQDVYGDTE